MPDPRAKACGYYRDGRIQVHHAKREPGTARIPTEVVADVIGHSSTHVVTLDQGVWHCRTCQAAQCVHIAAVQLATGHPSAAAKTETTHRRAG